MLFVPWRVRTNGILSRTLYSHIRVQLWNWFTFSPTFNFFVKKFLAIYKLTKLSRYLDRISNLQETARRISRAKFPGAIYSCSARDTATVAGDRKRNQKTRCTSRRTYFPRNPPSRTTARIRTTGKSYRRRVPRSILVTFRLTKCFWQKYSTHASCKYILNHWQGVTCQGLTLVVQKYQYK